MEFFRWKKKLERFETYMELHSEGLSMFDLDLQGSRRFKKGFVEVGQMIHLNT